MDTTGAFFESDEDDHTSLMQTSLDKGDEESLMQMQTKLKKRSQAAIDAQMFRVIFNQSFKFP